MSTEHWFALTQIAGIGGVTLKLLLDRFGGIESIFEASAEDLHSVRRVSEDMARAIRQAPLDQLELELLALADEGITVLTWEDEEYPVNLRAAADSPPLLFMRGTMVAEDERSVAVVGTRQPSAAALQIAEQAGRHLALHGVTVVSGLALGIDGAAHQGALMAGGRTVAVLGSGVRIIHPRSHTELAQRILAQGALLSELHPSAPVLGRNLMARDRITSGLSRAVIVVEAGDGSGSLDTALRARRQGRPVLAVDGGSPGTSRLIQEGATRLPAQGIDYNQLAAYIGVHCVASAVRPNGAEQLSLLPP